MEFMPGIYGSWQRIQEAKYKEMKTRLGDTFDEIFSGTILDIGCGFGYLEKTFKGRYIGLDNSADMLRNQVALFPRVLGNGSSLPFKNSSFDSVISIDAMHLIEGSDFRRVLKINGHALVSIFFNSQNYEERKALLLGKLANMNIIAEFEIHGKEKEYFAVARKQ